MNDDKDDGVDDEILQQEAVIMPVNKDVLIMPM
jgi:hypothetical protein